MKQQYVQTNSRAKAIKLMPWAAYIVRVCDGYHGFESYDDFLTFKGQV